MHKKIRNNKMIGLQLSVVKYIKVWEQVSKTEELIITSMQIKNSEMGDNPVGKFLVFYINTNIIKTAIQLILDFERVVRTPLKA
jgi:hypothetical protein